MKGFFNQILIINVSDQSYHVDPVDDSILEKYLGGKGLSTYLLLDHNPPGVDPLSPENRLIFATGPASGTAIWGSCRYGIYTKSPQTGFYSESYSGGTVADYMARTGFDAVMIYGTSENPVWLEIFEERVRFHSAKDLWGLDTYQTEDRVKNLVAEENSDHPRSGVVVIGPAGENGVAFSVVENDYWRSAGRTGTGAVMGSKHIKAIAFRGSKKKEVADEKAISGFAKEIAKRGKDDAGVNAFKAIGTTGMVSVLNHAGCFPNRYWHKGTFENWENISAEALHERCEVKPHACLKCFIACGRLSTVKEGRHAGLKIEGPEYETIYAFGGLCEVANIEEIVYLNDICDRLGMDTISAGNLVAFAIEASRQGKIDFKIDYGQVDAIAGLLKDMARRRGTGEILAGGIKAAAKEWGMEDQAIHIKGLEPPGYDPRVLKGMGLAYGTSDRGACHLRATFYKPELTGMIDPDQIKGKAAVFIEWEDRLTFIDTLILCRFYRDLYQWEELSTIVEGTTGLKLSADDMRSIATSVTDNTRRFNIREGLQIEDDRLPKRFHTEALESGNIITQDDMEIMLMEYYKSRGWDEKGTPPNDAPLRF
ncbi:MAG: aldehyde ferredoxin oxidoreductase family protein [Deltaproteobacteria bacterium]|nr:aldehyde ferredoxin oxidoreductase family protein [Deltaproteobacteria bacterium]MBW2116982.1 aldehyde ferredoxin oxidoreductase family protein [Deltaproteobacteria bacterium]MBW2343460.1 aldehyde ferredoxin oxidoreductase family protein [Deltaproteobacteria bacterium]